MPAQEDTTASFMSSLADRISIPHGLAIAMDSIFLGDGSEPVPGWPVVTADR